MAQSKKELVLSAMDRREVARVPSGSTFSRMRFTPMPMPTRVLSRRFWMGNYAISTAFSRIS